LKNKAGISEVTFYLPALSKQDYSRGFWLYGLDDGGRSNFDGDDGDLGSGADNARKILPKKVEVYTSEQISKALHSELKGLEESILKKLRSG